MRVTQCRGRSFLGCTSWLTMLREAAEAGRSTIFTFAPEASVPADFPDRAKRQIESAGGQVHFVRLVLSPEEQERRISNADRGEFKGWKGHL